MIHKIVLNALALAITTAIIPGIELTGGSLTDKVITFLLLAVIFGLVNALVKAPINVILLPLQLLTFGLISWVVNACMLLLTSTLANWLSLPWHVDGFWPAFIGAICMALVSWLIDRVLDGD